MTRELARLLRRAIAACAVLVLAAPAAGAAVIDPELTARLDRLGPSDTVSVIVRFSGSPELDRLKGQEKSLRRVAIVRVLRAQSTVSLASVEPILDDPSVTRRLELWAMNGIAVTASAEVIRALAEVPGVARISVDAVVAGPSPWKGETLEAEWNLSRIGAAELWSDGHTGEGVVLGSMDTGVDATHPDLTRSFRGGANSWIDPYGEHPAPHDRSGHGTQTMGVMVGGDAGGSAIGVAPDATWIAAKIFNDAGSGTLSAIHESFQWMLDPDGDPDTDDGADVVNGSWSLGNIDDCALEFEQDLQTLKAAEIAVVFAGGNYGPEGDTSVSPANNPSGFAVGVVDQADSLHVSSSRGPSACDGTVYPEVVAPGVNIRTTDLGSLYAWVTGASIAAPHVSGAMALLLSAHPEATVEQLERTLELSAVDLGQPGPDSSSGHGRIDLVAAEELLERLVEGVGEATVYTDEAEFLAAVGSFGTIAEGFEDDGAWGAARSPEAVSTVLSQGITWTSNHPANEISTSSGAAHSGDWGLFSDPHGDQSVPNPTDFIEDGVIGSSDQPLAAVGGWFRGTSGGELAVILDGNETNPVGLGSVEGTERFYGVVVDGSFTSFEFREIEGTLEDQKLIFVDDVSVAVIGGGANRAPDGVIVLPSSDLTVAPGEPVFFEAAASDPDGDPVTVAWDFGDGRSSTELAPGDIVYQESGTFTVTLTATDSHGLSDPTPASRTITVAPAMTGVVAGVANVAGAQGSDWHSDLYLHNAAAGEAIVELSYSPADGTVGAPETVTVAPDQTLALEDVVASVFGTSGSGAIFWRVVGGAADRLLVSANTYNRVDAVQRFGQQIPGVRWGDPRHAGSHVTVPALAGRYRSNLGFATGADCTIVAVTGFDRSGALVAQRTITVQPWSWVQLNSLFERVFPDLLPDPANTPVAESLHRFQVNGVDGPVVGYTSVIDNATNDGSYFLGQAAGGGGDQWLPGVAVISGANGSRWRSDVVAMNPSGGAITAEISYYPTGQDNGGPLDVEVVPLAAGESAFEGNILVELFGYAPPEVGSLEFASDAAVAPMLWMRTYTEEPAAGGGTVTYGQAILPLTAAATVAPGGEGRIAGFSHDAATRVNLILQNTRVAGDGTRLASEVSVELLAADGTVVHQQGYSLLPGEYRQHNRFVDDYGVGPVTHATLRITVLGDPGAGETGGVDAMVSEVNGNSLDGTNDGRLLRAELVAE
jgi:subtilisin family serine protease/PKD repeat protein